MIDPGMPDVLVEYGNRVFQRPDGQLTVGPNIVADKETWGQLVSGYRCAKCFGVQSEAFPEVCEFQHEGMVPELGNVSWRCGFRMRDEQLPELMRDFGGEADYEPRDPYDVLDIEQDDWKKTKSGIVVPSRVDAS